MTHEENRILTNEEAPVAEDLSQFIKRKLLSCKEKKEIVSVYSDYEDTEKFSAGFIQAVDDDFVLIAHVTPFGAYDGYIAKKLERIDRIEYGGKHENKLRKLYDIRKQSHSKVKMAQSIIIDLLLYSKENSLLCSAELLNC